MQYNVNDITDAIQDLSKALRGGFEGDLFNAELGRRKRIENYSFSVEPVKDEAISIITFKKSLQTGEWEILF